MHLDEVLVAPLSRRSRLSRRSGLGRGRHLRSPFLLQRSALGFHGIDPGLVPHRGFAGGTPALPLLFGLVAARLLALALHHVLSAPGRALADVLRATLLVMGDAVVWIVRHVILLPGSPGLVISRRQILAAVTPLRFLVHGLRRDAPQAPDHAAVEAARDGRHRGAGRLVHERHELVGEARHGAADADAAHVGAAAHAVDPPPLGHVALDHRTPAAELHDALGRAVLVGEVALLVIAGAVAPLVHRMAEEPRGAQL